MFVHITSVVNNEYFLRLVDRFHMKKNEIIYLRMYLTSHRFVIIASADRIEAITILKGDA